ncbi:uncharacterized protein LOC116254763 isoform X2 [Nymphaea colorata]|uniref:uncharacterized protein LOC116254763 isoform X2 n=1 Tax=Nymphaea colorata TaxID=210225 RepID=UPI00214F1604|nr:uncharacterized protein LOC116254763 isoform X2 [Nymphaea colorata]
MTMATPFHLGSCSAMAMAQTRGQAAESFRPDHLTGPPSARRFSSAGMARPQHRSASLATQALSRVLLSKTRAVSVESKQDSLVDGCSNNGCLSFILSQVKESRVCNYNDSQMHQFHCGSCLWVVDPVCLLSLLSTTPFTAAHPPQPPPKNWRLPPNKHFTEGLMATTVFQIRQAPTSFYGDQLLLLRSSLRAPGCVQITGRRSSEGPLRRKGGVGIRCALQDLIGGDLLKFDLGQWLDDVEKHKALAIYSPHEGGYEGRYLTRLRYQGYYFLDLSARGLGDPETTLTKIHPVCPAHLGRQPIARWYYPPEIDYRLSLLPPNSKGLILWVIEAKVLSKAELQFLALLPSIRPKVKVIAECGNWRKFVWKPLKEIAGLPLDDEA